MNAKEAADKLRPTFHLESMPTEDRHHVKFVEEVATELGVEHTAFNLHQVADALDTANIHQDSIEYPKMLFSRQHHAVKGIEPSVYDERHDYVWTHVANEDQVNELGSGWVDDPASLSPRGETPVDAPIAPKAKPEAAKPKADAPT